MSSITQAFYEKMLWDTALTSQLGVFQGLPAIYTAEPVPPESPYPLIISSTEHSGPTDVPEASKQRIASRPIRDIRIYDEATGSMERVESIAERVWELFHKQPISIDGWETIRCRAARPIIFEADGRVVGLVVSVTLGIEKRL